MSGDERTQAAATAGAGTVDGRARGADALRGRALATSMRAPTTRSAVSTPLEIVFIARNDTAETLELLLWNTPFEDPLSADLFVVERDGERLPYRGRLVKRDRPEADDFARLAPGQALEHRFDLARYYAVERPGRYEILFVPPPYAADGGGIPLEAIDEPLLIERVAPDGESPVEEAPGSGGD